jgi:hypothetical protein
MERAEEWFGLCLRLDAKPLTAANARQRHPDELAASRGALHCGLQHGSSLCEADCGEFRHRSPWMRG